LPTGISMFLSKSYEEDGDNRKQLLWMFISMILLFADFCILAFVISKMRGASSVAL
jgi:flagellar biogenesis protein FliO